MIVEDQSRTIQFLSDPATHGGAPVERIETHISEVFLAGERVHKLKRAVKLPYLDFSTAQLRLAACREEVARNRVTAPNLYLGVRRITQEGDGRLAFDGSGSLVDVVVEMVRFDQDGLFDRMAVDGWLTPALMDRLARAIARFHDRAPVVHNRTGFANIENVLAINAAGFATSNVFTEAEVADLDGLFHERLRRFGNRLDERERAGKIRRCHGDLHLRNICLIDGEPALFDCIEFNDEIATADVLYDLAFLLMDLWHRDLFALANLLANRYLDETDNDDGFILLAFFMAIRAAVRAHVIATHAQDDAPDHAELVASARSYFDLARQLLESDGELVIAIGGLSGSGKSTIAEALAPSVGAPPGARLFESDRIRKALFGKPPEARLGPEAYTGRTSERVYGELVDRSVQIAAEGATVIADATFSTPSHRDAIQAAVRKAGVPFEGIWLHADADVLRRRIAGRRGGPSDATVEVLESQLALELGEIGWEEVNAEADVEQAVRDIIARLPPSGS